MTPDGTIRAAFRGRVGAFVVDAAFMVPARGVTALFGPSGCGKTTVLRAVAGLQRFADGACRIDGETWQDAGTFLPPHRRPVGYVFQEASLFPHLSVRRNLLYGARGPTPPGAPDLEFAEAVDLLGLGALLDRGPGHLSGGERQRVAIGRALLSRPRLLLMDEPLSALDRASRDEILPFLERLHTRLQLPVLYVTHDRGEVERLADTLLLMRAGRVEASGPLADLQSDPASPFARDTGAAVVLDAVVDAYDAADALAVMAVHGHRLLVPTGPLAAGERRRVRIAAGDVSLARTPPRDTTILNVLAATILSGTPAADGAVLVVLALAPDGPRLTARVTRRSWRKLAFEAGEQVYVQVKSIALARS